MSLPSEQNWLVLQHLISDLTKKGYEFYSATDTEVAIKLIDYYFKEKGLTDLVNP